MTLLKTLSPVRIPLARLLLVLLLAAGPGLVVAGAVEVVDLPHAVVTSFRGQILVIKSLPEATHSDKELIAALKAGRLKELQGEPKGDVTSWSLRFLTFSIRPAPGPLKLEFFTEDKKLVADHLFEDAPAASCFELNLDIDEDEGLAKGKTYVLKLVNEHNAVIAETALVMK